MNIKVVYVLIAMSAVWGCENKTGQSSIAAQSSKQVTTQVTLDPAAVEVIPTAIEAAAPGSAQAVSAQAIESAKDEEELEHE